MKVLFPQNPMMKKLPEPIFEHEFDAAQSLGLSCLLFAEEVMSREGQAQTRLSKLLSMHLRETSN